MSTHFICATCGVQFAKSDEPPAGCPICDDERQYVGWKGQRWTTLEELKQTHHNAIRDDLGLTGIGTEPSFAIGQRALLVQRPQGNLLWDCITVLDDATVDAVKNLGGIRAIAISHPHYYSCCIEWADAFDAPVLLNERDKQWIMRPDRRVDLWGGPTMTLWDGMTLINAGGHFDGGTVLHWAGGAAGKGALLAGDIIQVAQDRRWVTFMYSFPNYIPLPARTVDRIVGAVEPYDFDRIYGAWWERNVASDAKQAVKRSAERYKRAISG